MKVALVHDYLTQYGGAERVLESLHDLFPAAPVFVSVTDLSKLPSHFSSWEIHNSPINVLPGVSRYHRALLPVFPALFRTFETKLAQYDLIIADSSAWSHGVTPNPKAKLICYCHSPARFLYGDQNYLEPARLPPIAKQVLQPVLSGLRWNDKKSASRVDRYIANSANVAKRIELVYGRRSTVIYPPVDVERFAPVGEICEPEKWFLVVSRLVPHKNVSLAVDACNRIGAELKIIGTGRDFENLRKRAGPTIEFLGQQDDKSVVRHLQRCKALILPGVEDFGMTAVEAQAAGRPVIARGEGGALESIVENETGLFFRESTAASLADAMKLFDERSWQPDLAPENARRFGTDRFKREITAEIDLAMMGVRS